MTKPFHTVDPIARDQIEAGRAMAKAEQPKTAEEQKAEAAEAEVRAAQARLRQQQEAAVELVAREARVRIEMQRGDPALHPMTRWLIETLPLIVPVPSAVRVIETRPGPSEIVAIIDPGSPENIPHILGRRIGNLPTGNTIGSLRHLASRVAFFAPPPHENGLWRWDVQVLAERLTGGGGSGVR